MEDFGLRPEPPLWALEGGLPAPQEEETFVSYVRRLGLKPEPLLAGLTERTIVIANTRFASRLQETMRPVFDRYVAKLAREHLTPERRKQIEIIASNVFGDTYRRRPR